MIARATLTIVVLVSLAHALVHVYEMSLPSVEQEIAAEHYPDDVAGGKSFTGRLSNAWRFMWGTCAILAGWLVDRFGSRRLLIVFLWGCSLTCGLAAYSTDQPTLMISMVLMGALASIYHPAGLALISHETTAETRPSALGLHGIFGSAGIGLAPFAIGVLTDAAFSWRQIYWVLLVPGVLLGAVFLGDVIRRSQRMVTVSKPKSEDSRSDYRSFVVLTLLAAVQGFIYSALLSFLVRYLDRDQQITESGGKYLASVVLLAGCFGQYIAGRWARPDRLERQLTWVTFGNVPFLLAMAAASGWLRPVTAGMWAVVHFMHQPVYNSLIAKYTSRERRSLCYGISFAMGLGIGSFGALFAGNTLSDVFLYSVLAGFAVLGGLIGLVLCRLNPMPLSAD